MCKQGKAATAAAVFKCESKVMRLEGGQQQYSNVNLAVWCTEANAAAAGRQPEGPECNKNLNTNLISDAILLDNSCVRAGGEGQQQQ